MQKLAPNKKKSEVVAASVKIHEKELITRAAEKRGITPGCFTARAAVAAAEEVLQNQ